MRGWWHRASTEQKLAQLDGGIQLGMTARQIAMASGSVSVHTVHSFAQFYGRKFGRATKRSSASVARQAAKKSAQGAYFRGEPVDLWREGQRARAGHQDEVEEIVLE